MSSRAAAQLTSRFQNGVRARQRAAGDPGPQGHDRPLPGTPPAPPPGSRTRWRAAPWPVRQLLVKDQAAVSLFQAREDVGRARVGHPRRHAGHVRVVASICTTTAAHPRRSCPRRAAGCPTRGGRRPGDSGWPGPGTPPRSQCPRSARWRRRRRPPPPAIRYSTPCRRRTPPLSLQARLPYPRDTATGAVASAHAAQRSARTGGCSRPCSPQMEPATVCNKREIRWGRGVETVVETASAAGLRILRFPGGESLRERS